MVAIYLRSSDPGRTAESQFSAKQCDGVKEKVLKSIRRIFQSSADNQQKKNQDNESEASFGKKN